MEEKKTPIKHFEVMGHYELKDYCSKRHNVFKSVILINDTIYKDDTEDFINYEANPMAHIYRMISLDFDDIDGNYANETPECTPMSIEQAKKILNFVEHNRCNNFIISCHAGVSRSAGVCAALEKIYNGDDKHIFNSPKYVPNRWCYRKVLDAAFEMGVMKI